MHTFTAAILRQACSLLAITLLGFNASAQTAPSWQSAYALGSSSEYLAEAAVDAAGNIYEVGSFTGTTTIAGTTLTSQGDFDGYLAKYTATGNLAWVRQLGSAGRETANGVALDAAGNVYITGAFTGYIELDNNLLLDGSSGASRKVFIIRYSPQGMPQWVQQSSVSGTAPAEGSSIGTDANGNVYVTGNLNRTITIGSITATLTGTSPGTGIGGFLARFSGSTGTLQSLQPAFNYFSTTNAITYTAPKLAVAATGEVFLLNTFYQSVVFGSTTLTTRGQTDVVAAKYNAQGAFEWVQQLGGPSVDRMYNGTIDAAGHLYLVGDFTGPATVGTTTVPGYGERDGFLVKYSPLGTVQWVEATGGLGADRLSDVQVDAAGNPYVTGTFSRTAQFGAQTLTSAGSIDIVVATYAPQGQLRWAQRAGGAGVDAGATLGLDAAGNVYAYGTFASSCSFGPLTLTTTAPFEGFIARLGVSPLATRVTQAISVSLFPNPATTTVHLPSVPVGSQVRLVDAVGRIACSTVIRPDASVMLQGVAPGLYVVRATDAQGRQYTGRLVVE